MSPARFSVERPVFVSMVTLMLLVLGGVAFSRLPIDLMPDVTSPTLSVSTDYENAGPEEIEDLVTRRIEEAVSAVPGVEQVTSTSSEGESRVRVTFTWGTNLDAAANDLRDRLDRTIAQLPPDVSRPALRKFDLASFPIMILGVASDLDPLRLRRLVDREIKYRLERVPGVAAVDIRGGLEREVRVEVDPDRLKALGLSLDQLIARLRAENANVPAGSVELGTREVLVRTPGEFHDLDAIRDTVIMVRDGAPVRLGSVATVEDGWRKLSGKVRVNGRLGVRLAVNKQAGTNTVEVAKGVKAEMARINAESDQVEIVPIVDTSAYIERSITNVGNSVVQGGLLAVMVLLVFLRSLTSTLVIALAIPISVIATFTVMYFAGFTLNLMTLGGLALGVGMLVDNSIVVLENIFRYGEEGTEVRTAAVAGGEEVTPAVIASTLTTVVVFLPLVFVRGMSGLMLQQLAYVVSVALFCSLVVSLTLVPMLSARLIGEERPGEGDSLVARVLRMAGRPLVLLEEIYGRALHWAMGWRAGVVLASVAALTWSLTLAPRIGVELMPPSDEGEVRVSAELEVGTRVEVVDERFAAVEEIVVREVPEARSWVAVLGAGGFGSSGGHTAEMRVALVPAAERKRSSEQIATALRKALAGIPGMTIRTRAGGGLFVMRFVTGDGTDKLQVEVRGHDLATADLLASRVAEVMRGVPGVTDVRLSRETGNPEESIEVDRQKAASLGLSVSRVAGLLETAIAGSRAGVYREGGEESPIMVRVAGADRMGLQEVLDLTVISERGEPVVLRNVVVSKPRSGPARIERIDRERVVTLSGNFTDRDQGSVIRDVAAALDSIAIPEGFHVAPTGDYEEQQKSFRELVLMFVLSLAFVYMVMACQYESLVHPFVVMFSVPFAAIGVLVLLWGTGTTFNVQSFIGCIMLGGIVVNNAILLVDQINILRRQDKLPMREAVAEAGRRRLRPIMMTALTTVLGLLPLALGIGEGGEAQAPLARAVIGGLVSSTLVTLFLVPAVYSVLDPGETEAPPNG